jgi:hypothetical protein
MYTKMLGFYKSKTDVPRFREALKLGANHWSKNVGRTNTKLLCAKIIAVIQKRVIAKMNQTMPGKGLTTRGTAAGMARWTQVKTGVGRKSVPKKPSKTVSRRKKEVPKKLATGKDTGQEAGSEADEEEVEEVVGRNSEPGGEEDDDDDANKLEVIPEVDGDNLHHKNKRKKPVVGRKQAPGSGHLKDKQSYKDDEEDDDTDLEETTEADWSQRKKKKGHKWIKLLGGEKREPRWPNDNSRALPKQR